MNSENKYNCDYAVPKKSEGSYKTKRTLLRLAYILTPLLIIVILFTFISYAAFIFVPLFLILSRPVINGTWRYVNYDQRYEIKSAGTIRFSRYYGRKFKTDKKDEHAEDKIAEKFILEEKIKDFEAIAPYNIDEYRKIYDAANVTVTVNCCSSPSAPNIYFAIYTNDKGEKCAILFDMIPKSLDIFKYYNRDTVVVELTFAIDSAYNK